MQFFLSDTDGITGRDAVSLALVPVPDQPPQVAAQLDGIGASITPQARVPVAGRVTDDYGIGRVWFDQAVDSAKPRELLIARLAAAATVFPLSAAALEVRDLGVKPGQKVQLSVMASDLCDLGHGPNTAGSERWQLDVVTPEQLRAVLEARELVLRQRLERIIQETTEGRDVLARLRFDAGGPAEPARTPAGRPKTLRPAGAEPGDEEPADSPARQRAVRLLAVQGALTDCRKSTQEVLGLAEAFDNIRKQLVNNRIDTEELKKRLQHGIAEPLHVVAETMFPELDRRLEALQVAVDNLEQGPLLRNSAEREADEILLAMRKVLDRMIEMEDFNEVIEMLRNIIQSQDRIHDKTQRTSQAADSRFIEGLKHASFRAQRRILPEPWCTPDSSLRVGMTKREPGMTKCEEGVDHEGSNRNVVPDGRGRARVLPGVVGGRAGAESAGRPCGGGQPGRGARATRTANCPRTRSWPHNSATLPRRTSGWKRYCCEWPSSIRSPIPAGRLC